MAGYTRQSTADIVTGLVVEAQPINNEYDAIETAMAVAGGHNHDGTAGGGAPINLATSLTGTLGLDRGGTNANLTGAVTGAHIVMGASSGLTWVKNNLAGASTPTVSNDSSQGYTVTSLWLYVPSGRIYMCTTAAVGAAAWTELNDSIAVGTALGKVKVSSTDTTTDYLKNKITATTPLTVLQTNTGSVETLNFSIALSNGSTTVTGILALATTGQVDTGTDTTRAVTAAGINDVYFRKSSLATTGQVQVGTSTITAVTPAGLAAIDGPTHGGAIDVGSATVSGAAFARYKITATGILWLPTFAAREWIIVEFAATNGVLQTVNRGAQTLDGVAANDTCTTKGPIVEYYCTTPGAVVTTIIGSVPS